MTGWGDECLCLIKTDGYGVITWINEINLDEELRVYPNPSSAHITIKLPQNPQKKTSLTIYNLNGQQLITQAISEPQTEIDISHLPAGIYIIKVWNDNDVMVQKVIKK